MNYIRVHVTPSAKRESLIALDDKTYAIAVREPSQENRANIRVREVLAEHLGLALSKVRMTAGHHSPRKLFDIGF